jgi:hypothetical protein
MTSASSDCFPEDVLIRAVVVPELRFHDVERQVLGADLVEAANDGPLKLVII